MNVCKDKENISKQDIVQTANPRKLGETRDDKLKIAWRYESMPQFEDDLGEKQGIFFIIIR